jgi:hypothetical protein
MAIVTVTCDNEERPVFIDNQMQGMTDTPLGVPEGLHVFDLGAPPNYTPSFQEVDIGRDPIVIAFTLMPMRVARRARKVGVSRRARKAKKAAAPRKRAARGKKLSTRSRAKRSRAKRTSTTKRAKKQTTKTKRATKASKKR